METNATISPVKEVYEKFKHLDFLLSDLKWLPDDMRGWILFELWQAIRNEVKGEKT